MFTHSKKTLDEGLSHTLLFMDSREAPKKLYAKNCFNI